MTENEWCVQYSWKTPTGDMINVRGSNEDDFTTGLTILKKALQSGQLAELGTLIFGNASRTVQIAPQTAPAAPGSQIATKVIPQAGNGYVDGTVTSVEPYAGVTNGRQWKKTTVRLNTGFEGVTFDNTLGQIFLKLQGVAVRIHYGPDQKGKNKIIKVEDLAQLQVV